MNQAANPGTRSGSPTLEQLLAMPAPRPLAPLLGGPALTTAILGTIGSMAGLAVFLVLLSTRIITSLRDPWLGDTAATMSVLGCLAGAALFVHGWVAAASGWRRIALWRSGTYIRGVVNKLSRSGEGEPSMLNVTWHIRSATGHVQSMRISMALPRGGDGTGVDAGKPAAKRSLAPGDPLPVLYPARTPSLAVPVGLLGLRRKWHINPAIQPPAGSDAFTAAGIWTFAILSAIAFAGLTANRTLDPGFLRHWVWWVSIAAVAASVPAFALLRRYGPWLRMDPWVLLAAFFLASSLGAAGAVSGSNVWLDSSEPVTRRVKILHMDDEYFPGWHMAAFVESWREGRVKERIPLHWRTGLSVFPGDELFVEVREGAHGWPTVGRVSGKK